MAHRLIGRLWSLGVARWRGDARGAAAVEFGLVAPVLIVALLAVIDGGVLTLKHNAMHTGVSAGAQYAMAGGTSLDAIRQVTLSAWPRRTQAATVSATKVCRCGAAVAVCTVLCADASVPKAYIVIAATDRVSIGMATQSLSTTQEVRIR